MQALISPRPALEDQRLLNRTEVLIQKMDEVSQSVKVCVDIIKNYIGSRTKS